jgi:MFS transporter, SHS family, sialic acid transporter
MTLSPPAGSPSASTATQRGALMALVAALLGWMFDGAEMGLFSMVGNAAIEDLLEELGRKNEAGRWFGIIIATFLMGAATGGVVFGWLGDRIGRVRAMSLSVLVYALFTGFCGFVTSVEQLALLRFIASLGMGGEWALGVALVMEVWPNKSRAFMAGLIGAAANVGYLLVGVVGLMLDPLLKEIIPSALTSLGMSQDNITTLTAYKGWRLMMMLGTAPAILTFAIRIFVPESHKWEEEQAKGQTSNWQTIDLLGVLFGMLGPTLIIAVWAYELVGTPLKIVLTLLGLLIAAVGFTYPVLQYLRRSWQQETITPEEARGRTRGIIGRMLLGAGLSGVALMGTWGSTQWAAKWAGELTKNELQSREWTQIYLSIGACIGTIAAAMAGDWLGRRMSYFLMCLLALLSAEYLYGFHTQYNGSFLFACLLAGMFTASFYGWLPLYLPELFPTKVRATGQGFAFNFGRILAAIGALQTGVLITKVFDNNIAHAGMTTSCIYFVGMILIWFAPETRGKPLPE